MTKSSQREKFNFLHVLEGGKGKQESASESSGKSQQAPKQPTRKPASPAKSASAPKRKSTKSTKSTKNQAVQKNRSRSKRQQEFIHTLSGAMKSLVKGLGKAFYYGIKAILIGPVRLFKNKKAQLRTALPYLIIIGSVSVGGLLAYGSHLLVESRSAQSIARLLEIKSLVNAGTIPTAPSPIFENPWSWKNIRVQQSNGQSYAIIMEGVSDVGCKNIFDATFARFSTVTVNGLQVEKREEARRLCSRSANALTFVVNG